KAPCFKACPTHQDIQAYVGLIANGETEEAIKVIKKDNPLPRSIGRVCPHPCEDACRRNHLEGAVSICSLKRFAGDECSDYIPECAENNGKKVAVIGGGPAGLSCAYFLLLKGYSVDVFEAEAKAGGMLRYGIPAYRLPKDVLDKEIENISKMGAEFNYNKKLGKDFTIAELKEKYDAVFVATGAWKSSSLRCDGDNASGVIGGIDMLYKVANGENVDLGKKVAVVGGGNTAIDAVRTAVRLGAESVTLIYRRTESEMPAEKDEIKDAKEEGVNFKFLVAPLNVVTENGKVKGINLQKMELGEPDSSGRRSPVAIDGETEILYCDTIISAIGQQVVSEDVKELELTKKGTVSADENSFITSIDGVFAAGDVINKGPDIAVRAIAGGKNAARSIDCYLNGIVLTPELPQYAENKEFDIDVLCGAEKVDRVKVSLENADVRKNNFSEVASVLTKAEAMKEASRCLECGCASVYDCKLLPLMREYDSWEMKGRYKTRQYKKDKSHPFIVRDNNKCILCGLCVRVCNEISHTENLGLFGRGFGTIPMNAFDLPLGESKCVSCGACVNTCPTGALTSRTPTVKNIVLPYLESKFICKGCENSCEFTRRSVNGKTVKMIPCDLRKSCSIGVFGLVAVENSVDENIISYIKGDLRNFKGNKNALNTLIDIENLLK
ncbi:MAG: FAD-dependent oxidoreductase, partial [Clostridia bacterium]|nr:FAD-dependent oxidoreductase [Clostridia bacterium]